MKTFVHIQTTASALWNINHNLNSDNLIINVVDNTNGTVQVIIPYDKEIVDENNIKIHFTSPRSGICRILAPVTE